MIRSRSWEFQASTQWLASSRARFSLSILILSRARDIAAERRPGGRPKYVPADRHVQRAGVARGTKLGDGEPAPGRYGLTGWKDGRVMIPTWWPDSAGAPPEPSRTW